MHSPPSRPAHLAFCHAPESTADQCHALQQGMGVQLEENGLQECIRKGLYGSGCSRGGGGW